MRRLLLVLAVATIVGAGARPGVAREAAAVASPWPGPAAPQATGASIPQREPLRPSRRLAFEPTDPLAFFQWYLQAIHAFDYWPEVPALAPVRVAVIDSGADATHPDLRNRIVAARSFVGGKATEDESGHGTMVAGEIAAALDNGEGIAGVGFPVELVVAKVRRNDGVVPVQAEAAAIRWAVDQGARVVNLSLGAQRTRGGTRDPQYSPVEQAAIAYAYESGAVVVAATGNCSASCPHNLADFPAALPHVLGVGALAQDGSTPRFSNRDPVYNDLVAPGVGIISAFPLALSDPACSWPGYSLCATGSLRNGSGTSFAAPLASAAAALLIAVRPSLTPSQVMAVLERSAADVGAAGRDAASGHGRLDVLAALAGLEGPLPPADRFETNDDAGAGAHRLGGRRPVVQATIDYFDDPTDVYGVYVRRGRPLRVKLTGSLGGKATIVLWRPGTAHVTELTQVAVRSGAILARKSALSPAFRYRAKASGWYFVQVKAPPRGGGAYSLTLRK